MVLNPFRARPSWVDEERFIQSVLHHFVDQLDKGVKPQFRVSQRNTPELYEFSNDDHKYFWELIKSLDNEYHIITIKKQRIKPGRESYEGAQLIFNNDKEPLIREWLNRPAFDPYTLTWSKSFNKIKNLFEDGGDALEQPLRAEAKTAGEILQGFADLASQIGTQQTLRNLSAKCFWGDSKFLDGKLELIQKLFPEASHNITPRPLLMNISLPDHLGEVLFVENLDSFLMLQMRAETDPRLLQTALVYSAGFKGSSASIRKSGEVIFSALRFPDDQVLRDFKDWWHQIDNKEIPCFFWGDLDYAGMGILSALRRAFTGIVAWQPGYKLMLELHQRGHGHEIRDSKKMKQLDPRITGCEFSDDILLPAIRKNQRFLDQEIIALADL